MWLLKCNCLIGVTKMRFDCNRKEVSSFLLQSNLIGAIKGNKVKKEL